MAGLRNNITPDQVWGSNSDMNWAHQRQMQHEIEYHWEFMHWLKMHYPEALAEWNALNKLKEE